MRISSVVFAGKIGFLFSPTFWPSYMCVRKQITQLLSTMGSVAIERTRLCMWYYKEYCKKCHKKITKNERTKVLQFTTFFNRFSTKTLHDVLTRIINNTCQSMSFERVSSLYSPVITKTGRTVTGLDQLFPTLLVIRTTNFVKKLWDPLT